MQKRRRKENRDRMRVFGGKGRKKTKRNIKELNKKKGRNERDLEFFSGVFFLLERGREGVKGH